MTVPFDDRRSGHGLALLDRIRSGLDATWATPSVQPAPVPLSARADVAALAWASVSAASLAASQLAGADPLPLDPHAIAAAYQSERYIRIDGTAPDVWAPLSGFFPAADGWVRTHGNYPHHADALRRGLRLGPTATPEDVAAALRRMSAAAAERDITATGGLCVRVETEHPETDRLLRGSPPVAIARVGEAPARVRAWGPALAPLRGLRVLDLTRVIAGPVATRTLALLGADVLRIDPPGMPEPAWQHLDTGHGKRTALLDVGTPAGATRLEALLAGTDVVVTGYRPSAIARLGLDPSALAARHPGLVVARLSAWGFTGAGAERRGFDSLVQAASGIAWIESPDGERPGALPAQALDHSAGYLLTAGIITAVDRQARQGGSWAVETSLRRLAAELLGLPRMSGVEPPASEAPPRLNTFDLDGLEVQTAAPAIAYSGSPRDYAAPRPWGSDSPEWV